MSITANSAVDRFPSGLKRPFPTPVTTPFWVMASTYGLAQWSWGTSEKVFPTAPAGRIMEADRVRDSAQADMRLINILLTPRQAAVLFGLYHSFLKKYRAKACTFVSTYIENK